MQILVIAATPFEIAPFRQWIRNNNIREVNTCITGIGLMATAYHLTRSIMTSKPGFIIQAGLAGSFDPMILPGEVRVISNEIIGDLGAKERSGFADLFSLNLLNPDQFPFKNKRLPAQAAILEKTGLKIADAVSVNEITTSSERIEYYKKETGASLESMEGAALHYVGLMEHLPFLQLRAVSNFIGERDKKKWKLDLAIEKLNDELILQVKKLIV